MIVLSWNIHMASESRAGVRAPKKTAAWIKKCSPQHVLIQEAAGNPLGLADSKREARWKELVKLCGFKNAMLSLSKSNHRPKSNLEGIMSRDRLMSGRVIGLTSTPWMRTAQLARAKGVTLVSVHLHYEPADTHKQAHRLVAALRGMKGPMIVAGDWNALPGSPAYLAMIAAGFVDATAEAADEGTMTWGSYTLGLGPIDFQFARGGPVATSARRIATEDSDHPIILVDYELPAAGA